MTVRTDILYSDFHSYIYPENGLYIVGVSDYIIKKLGIITKISLPAAGEYVYKGEIIGTLESENAAVEIYTPLTGEVAEVNPAIIENPGILNNGDFEAAFLIKLNALCPDVDSKDLTDERKYMEKVCEGCGA